MEIPRKPDDAIEVFRLEMPIRWGDMDAMGHLNNTLYFRFMEQARISWFDYMGFKLDAQGQGPTLLSAGCTFIKQFEYPGTILIRKFVGRVGNSSVDTYSLLSRTDSPDRVDAEGCGRLVWVNFSKQKSVAIPPEARATMTKPWAESK